MPLRRPGIVAALVAALVVTTSPALAEEVPPVVEAPAVGIVGSDAGPQWLGGLGDLVAAGLEETTSWLGGLDLSGAVAGLGAQVRDGLTDEVAQAVSVAAANPCSGTGSTLRKTRNGSLTVLLLGSDYRSGAGSERTDTVIVANIAKNGRVAMVAIPRDTVRIPLATGGTSGSSRVNSLYQRYKRSSVGRRGVDCKALDRVRKDIAKTLGTEIPYYAFIRMDEFGTLINHVGGLRMRIRYTLIDYHYRRSDRKVYVPRSTNYRMNGSGKCGKKPKLCRNALKYVRSRYGTEGGSANSDFRRVRRQQEVVFWAIKRVVSRGSGANLTRLLAAGKSRVWTNLPKTPGGARALFAFVKNARFKESDGKVFGPSRWARYVGRYTFQLKLTDVRRWVDNHFKP